MYNRVLLVAPPSSSYLGAVRPPTGLGYISQALQDAGIANQGLDMRTRGKLSVLHQAIDSFRPDLIGVSLVSYEYARSYELIRNIKEYAPNVAVVAGGPHVSILQADMFKECPQLDYCVIHEGELSIVEMCKGEKPLSEIPGLLYREDGEVRQGPPQVARKDLDAISFPRYETWDTSRYAREIPLITSRGCPYRCTFCANSLTAKTFRARGAQHVVDEIEYWYRRGIRQFNIDDDNFTLIESRVYEICDEIERRGIEGLFIRCANGVRADRTPREMLARMKQIGVHEVAFGADGGNDRVLQEIVNKGEKLEDIERAIRDAIDLGMKVKLFILVGSPGETMSDIEDSIALAQRYPVTWVHLNNPIPYPGTKLYEWVKEHNAFLVPPEDYLNGVTEVAGTPVFETAELPRDVRIAYLARCRKIEKDVKRRAVEGMFANLPVVRTVAGHVFASSFGQWLFFRNMVARGIINRVWYRKMVQSTKGAA